VSGVAGDVADLHRATLAKESGRDPAWRRGSDGVRELVRMEDVSGPGSLKHVSFVANRGEVTGLLGLNHSGKSELMRILCGFDAREGGRVYFEDRPVNFTTPLMARDAGICYVLGEGSLVGDFTVAENIYVMRPAHGRVLLNHRQIVHACERLLFRSGISLLGIRIGAEQKAKDLGAFEKIVVLILRAMAASYKLIILDHVLTNLPQGRVQDFHAFLGLMLDAGASFILSWITTRRRLRRCATASRCCGGGLSRARTSGASSIATCCTR